MTSITHITKMTSTILLLSCALASPALADSSFDSAWDKERFQIRLRGISVQPDDSSNVNIGGNVDVGDFSVMPEVDLTYFVTEKIALEAIASSTPHQIYYNGDTNLGGAWILPPTVTLQYHPLRNEADFSPYVGVGVNYSYFYGEETGTGFTDLEVEGGFGYALQAGADYWINDNWGFNLDIKKIYLDVDASLNNGAITADVELDPWVLGAGISYKF